MNLQKKRILSLIALAVTVCIWGAGFVFSDMLIKSKMPSSMINTIRFCSATVLIGVVFCRKIKFDKTIFLYGIFGGALLFCAFGLQLEALNYTTPAYNGFFTAAYILFVPFIMWIIFKRRPNVFVVVGILVALAGFFILNFGGTGTNVDELTKSDLDLMLGNLMTIGSALFFGVQLVLGDYALNKKKVDLLSFTFSQVMFTAVFFLIFFAIEINAIDFAIIQWDNAWFPLCFVAILGTAVAYPCQTNAQLYVAPSETSLILSLEAVIGTVLSILVGSDIFSWYIAVGGLLVMLALLIVEVVPDFIARRKKKKTMDKE